MKFGGMHSYTIENAKYLKSAATKAPYHLINPMMEVTMGTVMTVLAFGTISFVALFGYLASRATERLKDDPNHKPSTLCVNSAHWANARK